MLRVLELSRAGVAAARRYSLNRETNKEAPEALCGRQFSELSDAHCANS